MTQPTKSYVLSGNDFPEAVFTDEASATAALNAYRAREEKRREAALTTSTSGQGRVYWYISIVPLNPQVNF